MNRSPVINQLLHVSVWVLLCLTEAQQFCHQAARQSSMGAAAGQQVVFYIALMAV